MKKMTPNLALFAVILAVNLRVLSITMFDHNGLITPSLIYPLIIMIFTLIIEGFKRLLADKKLLRNLEFQLFMFSIKIRFTFSIIWKKLKRTEAK